MQRFSVRRVIFRLFTLPVLCLVWATPGWGLEAQPASAATETAAQPRATLEWQISERGDGRRGGELEVSLTAEPRTYLPLVAYDTATRAVLERMHAGLVRLDRATLEIQPALARSWDVSPDRRKVRLELRRGVRFSDGEPFDADDVIFTMRAVQDPALGAAQASSLVIDGQPVKVAKLDRHTVEMELPYAHPSPLLLLSGVAMLPAHRLAAAHEAGSLKNAWGLGTEPRELVGLGPFRLARHRPAENLVLERNPHYWRRDAPAPEGTVLPYMERIVFRFVADETAKILRFRSGATDLLEKIPGDVFGELQRRHEAGASFEVRDLGPGLGYTFLVFNLNEVEDMPEVERTQAWFRQSSFRRAISLAIDRPAIARLVYYGRATPLVSAISPVNKRFYDESLEDAGRALRGPRLDAARAELRQAGFVLGDDGLWRDAGGVQVSFTLVANTANAKHSAIATLVQEDLRRLGLDVTFVGIEFGALVERLTGTFDYDMILLEFGGGDIDPNSSLNIWRIGGDSHYFHLGAEEPAFEWEAEVDRLMRLQARTIDSEARRELVVAAQRVLAEEVPFVFLVAPDVLVGAAEDLGNFTPSFLDHPTLWNADELYWRSRGAVAEGH